MSATSTIPLFGRAWKLSVRTAGPSQTTSVQSGIVGGEQNTPTTEQSQDTSTVILSQSGWDPEALRVTFSVLETTLPSPFWFADITVYNLNDPTLQNLLFNAVWLTLEAGYQFGPSKSTIIWDGPVLQVLFDRKDVVDLTMTFNCMAGPWNIEEQFINTSHGPQSTQSDVVSAMISYVGGNPSQQVSDYAQQLLQAKKYPRGKTIFGKVSKYIAQMSNDNFLNTWLNGNQNYISELANPSASTTPDLIFGPALAPGQNPPANDSDITRSIIGVPKQSPFGVDFTVLLDPRLKVKLPPLLCKLDRTVISQLKLQYGQVLTPLDKDALVVAAQVRHFGDTRGNDWYTTVTGYTRNYAQGLLSGTFVANAQGGT